MFHDLSRLAQQGPVHFMGIGGAGMTPLADLLLRSGGRVTGCDAQHAPALDVLRVQGAEIVLGHDPAHVAGCAALVITAAVAPDHPEICAARERGIPVFKRAEALGALVNGGEVVGVAGTHGKTTTTVMTAAVLAAGGLHPTALAGGRVPAWGGNLLHGGQRLFVVEADEYDRSFLTLRPRVAVVTTLEADHLDVYGSLDAIEDAFASFLEPVPSDGAVVLCGDDHGAGRLAARIGQAERTVVTYGTGAGSMLRAERLSFAAGETRFAVRERGRPRGEMALRAPGVHNVLNALAAAAVGLQFGLEWEAVAEGLRSYTGVERRFERVGDAAGVILVDDYAHHPTELRATVRAARSAHPDRRLVAVFQPHLYSRTRDFADEFGRALAEADLAFVTDVYAAREAAIPGVSGVLVADAARTAGADVRYHPDREGLPEAVVEALRPGDLCLTLGAGDLDRASRRILSLLGPVSG
ncbi:MAG: UDP-N-acetylmuramate--L-alanine ligase [Gemmatimonadota bacterium]|jgi:UDP-N-acetylmuramate--alanine ligase|nr:UDP-N-acetylmuramate--L-alanine ligase [Gemmatimonadota bacterium]